MKDISRNDFLKICGGLMLVPITEQKKTSMPLSFSTLGCPDWTLQQIIDFAASHDYNGVEIRGIQREMDLAKSPHFSSPEAINNTKKMFADKNLRIINLGSSCELHHADSEKRKKNLDEGRRFADLAAAVGCPFIRVFPNSLPADQDRQKTMELISAGLTELGAHAKGTGVKILMETHGDLLKSTDIKTVMDNVRDDHTGLVWDISNMWSVTKEDPTEAYANLKKYILHTHIKDLSQVNGKDVYKFVGKGEVPIFKAIGLLLKDNYKGYFSLEWEKMWHPEIEAPELAFADYPIAMKKEFQSYFHK